MNFLHCLLHFHVQGNCSLGPLLAGVYLVLSGKYSSDFVFLGNESVREREWFLTSPLQAPTLPQHLSRLFIRCKHLRPTSLSPLAHTFYVFTRVPAHRQVLEQLHLPPLWAPRQHPGYYLLSFPWKNTFYVLLGVGACKCFFTGAASLLWPSPPHTDLAEMGFYHSTQSLYIHRVFFCTACWLIQLQNNDSEIVFKTSSVQNLDF